MYIYASMHAQVQKKCVLNLPVRLNNCFCTTAASLNLYDKIVEILPDQNRNTLN